MAGLESDLLYGSLGYAYNCNGITIAAAIIASDCHLTPECRHCQEYVEYVYVYVYALL